VNQGLDRDINRKWLDNRLSESMRTYLGYLGVVYTGKRSKKEGRKVLELSLPRFIGIDDIRGV